MYVYIHVYVFSHREFASKGSSALAQEVLAEVPQQVLKYMSLKGIKPNPKRAQTDACMYVHECMYECMNIYVHVCMCNNKKKKKIKKKVS